MNFYKHHLGDYDSATSHLTWDEDMAYSRLLRVYYREEKPIPADPAKACRLVRATTKIQRRAVAEVLAEFFYLDGDLFRNKRADAEIEQANAQSAANRKIAEEREATKRARLVNESLHESPTNRSTNRSPVPKNVVNLARLQTPDSNSQTPIASKSREAAPPKPSAPAGPIPKNWIPDPEVARQLRIERPDLDFAIEFLKFRDHHESKGHARTDWTAAYRYWIRNARVINGSHKHKPKRRAKSVAELEAEEAARAQH